MSSTSSDVTAPAPNPTPTPAAAPHPSLTFRQVAENLAVALQVANVTYHEELPLQMYLDLLADLLSVNMPRLAVLGIQRAWVDNFNIDNLRALSFLALRHPVVREED